MKTFKITKKTNEVISRSPLNYISGGTSGNDLYVVVEKDAVPEINIGGKLIFEKAASGNSGQMIKVCEETVDIKDIVQEGDYLYIYFDYLYIKKLVLASYNEIETPDGYKYKLYFNGPHDMLPCDIEDEDYRVYIRRGKDILEFGDLAFCYPEGLEKGEDIIPEGGECCDDTVTLFNYETMERNSILAETMEVAEGDEFKPEPGDQVIFATNPYFHIVDDRIELYGCSGETVTLYRYTDFMGLGVVLEQDYDAKRMFQEYQVNELFVNKIKNAVIPDFIDLEKIKYAPAFVSGSDVYLATGLTFNLHFRTRVSGTTNPDVDPLATKYYFEDVWHLNDAMDTWNGNGFGDTKKREDLYLDEDFVNSSNLIGFLGFTDDDIYNQKNRVRQTFIRLSFYDSSDPLTQNLLYYSTIFLDSGELYGKYVKRKAWLEEEDDTYNHEIDPVVWSPTAETDTCSAVTSQLIVNDEYDMTRSGEGFNLYLFRQDAPIENSGEPIYMKVEFNHAGIGRTVPLIFWPKDENGDAERLTIENYLSNLYIKMNISLTERGYVYTFSDAVSGDEAGRNNGIIWENERLVLNLFEPMIETERIERDTDTNG